MAQENNLLRSITGLTSCRWQDMVHGQEIRKKTSDCGPGNDNDPEAAAFGSLSVQKSLEWGLQISKEQP
jgi:hypothetical protein